MKKKIRMAVCLLVVFALCAMFTACQQTPAAETESSVPAAETETAAETESAPAGGAGSSAPAEEPGDAGGDEKYSVGVILNTLDVPFGTALVDGAKEAGEEFGLEIDIQDGTNDANVQIAAVQNMIAGGKDAIVLQEYVVGTMGEALKEAQEAGLVIVGLNRALNYEGVDVAANVHCDNVEMGYIFGQAVSEMLGGDDVEGLIGVITGPLEDSATQERCQGLYNYMEDNNVAWEIIEQDGRWQKDSALAIMEDWLVKYQPGEMDGVIVQEPYSAIGVAELAQADGRDELVGKVICCDAPKEVNEAIENGLLYAAIRQDPKEQGYMATEAAYKTLIGEPVNKTWITPLPLVTKENVEEYPPTW
jgi:ABC-type sugar transport system substrate-binding protein